MWVVGGLTVDQVVGAAETVGGAAGYDALTRVLRASFAITAESRYHAESEARQRSGRVSLSSSAVFVAVTPYRQDSPVPHSPVNVEVLAPWMGGVWLVVTQGSCHIWDLDSGTYTRIPSADSGSGAFKFDRQAMTITAVERWPQVGSNSRIWYGDPAVPDRREHWRQSSKILLITELRSAAEL
jgi:hypothetical protein